MRAQPTYSGAGYAPPPYGSWPQQMADQAPGHVVWESADVQSVQRSSSGESGRDSEGERRRRKIRNRVLYPNRTITCPSEDQADSKTSSSVSTPGTPRLPGSSSQVHHPLLAGHVVYASSPSQSNAGGDSGSDSNRSRDQAPISFSHLPVYTGAPGEAPLDENGNITSVGSAKHAEGLCKPCLFTYSKEECKNGVNCEFCHIPHKRRGKARPCKKKRDRYQKLINRWGPKPDGEDSEQEMGPADGQEEAEQE